MSKVKYMPRDDIVVKRRAMYVKPSMYEDLKKDAEKMGVSTTQVLELAYYGYTLPRKSGSGRKPGSVDKKPRKRREIKRDVTIEQIEKDIDLVE